MWLLYYFNFERNFDVVKSKSPYLLLNKNINFDKNKTKSKMENATHSFRQTNLVLQLIDELQVESKTVISWSTPKKGTFFVLIKSAGKFHNICALSQYIMYLINISIFTYQKALLHTPFWLLLSCRNPSV